MCRNVIKNLSVVWMLAAIGGYGRGRVGSWECVVVEMVGMIAGVGGYKGWTTVVEREQVGYRRWATVVERE